MNKAVNKLLLGENKSIPVMHLRQPRFTYSAFGPFPKNKERKQKFRETGDARYICQNKLDKTCFQHDMAYGDFRDLPRRTTSNNVLRHKSFNIAKNPKHDSYQKGLSSVVYNFLIRSIEVVVLKMKIC